MSARNDHDTRASGRLQSIMRQVRRGHEVLPILSHIAMFDLALFGYRAFQEYYAEQIEYPYRNLPGIGQLANYDRYIRCNDDIECKEFYLSCVKEHILRQAERAEVDSATLEEARYQIDRMGVSAFARLLGYPRYDQPQTLLLRVLANLPFKIYLVIGVTTFLEEALRRAHRTPVTRVLDWRGEIEALDAELSLLPAGYEPNEDEPLVYHLCGLDAHPISGTPLPDSLALSEDDHLQMLVNLALDRGNNAGDRLPSSVRGAVSANVVLLGFRLDSWAFRVLYYGLIRRDREPTSYRRVCVLQLDPEERKQQEPYLRGYLDRKAHFDIFEGDLHDFARELRE